MAGDGSRNAPAKRPGWKALLLCAACLLAVAWPGVYWGTGRLQYFQAPPPPPPRPLAPPPPPPRAWPPAPPPKLCQAGEGQAEAGAEAACPLLYERQTAADIEAGSVPYLFGGPQRPCCRQCLDETAYKNGHSWPKFCRFESHGPLCTPEARTALLQSYLDRKFEGPLTLSPCDFWPYLRGRTLWFIGDSQALDFYKAMICFMYEFWDGSLTGTGVEDPEVLEVMRKILPPSCVELPQGSRICYVRADTGQSMVEQLLPVVPKFASAKDIAVVNFGLHHWEKQDTKWVPSYEHVLARFCAYVSKHRAELPALFWQQTPPQHFPNSNSTGEFSGGLPPFTCAPLPYHVEADGALALNPWEEGDVGGLVLRGGWRNEVADRLMRGLGLPIVESWNESAPLWDMHRDNGKGHECTHSCFPGAPQTWVYNLYRAWHAGTLPPHEPPAS